MGRYLILALSLLFAAPAFAQSIYGPLQAQNSLSEIKTNGTQANALSNLAGNPSAGTYNLQCSSTSSCTLITAITGGAVNSGTSGQLTGYTATGTTVSGLSGLTFSGGALTHGVAGSVVGSDIYANATSGTITVTPPTGALGSVTETLPSSTGTLLNSVTGAAIAGSSSQVFSVATPAAAANAIPLSYYTPVNNTSAGSDITLNVGQNSYITVSAATSIPLHIATGDNQLYELTLQLTTPPTYNATASIFEPNNTTYSSSFSAQGTYGNGGGVGPISYTGLSSFPLNGGATTSVPSIAKLTISTKTISKNIIALVSAISTGGSNPSLLSFWAQWNDTTTPWNSLGTIVFPVAATGQIVVTRIQ